MLLFATLGCALAAAYLTSRWSWVGLLFVVFLNPFDFAIPIAASRVYTNEWLLTGIFLGWAWALLRRAEERKAFPITEALWAVPFFIALLLSGIHALHFSAVVKQTLRWLELFALMLYAVSTVRTLREVRMLVYLIIGMGTLVSLWGIFQTIAGPQALINAGRDLLPLEQGTIIRAYSTFGHSNQLAGYIVPSIMLAFMQFVEGRSFGERLTIGACTMIMVTSLIFTFSRGAWISAVLVGSVLIYLNIPKKLFVMGTLLLAIAVMVVLINQGPLEQAQKAVLHRVNSFGHPDKDDSVTFRKVCIQTAIKMFKQRPWLGFGAGEYRQNIQNYFDAKYYAWEAINKHIHNLYLQILIESGLLGLLSFLAMLGYYVIRATRTLFRSPPSYSRQVLSGLLAGVVAFLIHNNFDVVTIFARGIHFGLVLGLALALVRQMETGEHAATA